MSQNINIEDYVNLNLDQNDMATLINHLQNNQLIDNIMEQMENVSQNNQLPMQNQQSNKQLQQSNQQLQQSNKQLQQPNQQLHQQLQQQLQQQSPRTPLKKFNPENNTEDNIIILSESIDKIIVNPVVNTQPVSKISIKEIIMILLLYLFVDFGIPFKLIVEYIPIISLRYVFITIRTLIFIILYSMIKYYLL